MSSLPSIEGRLWQLLVQRTRSAQAAGALRPIETRGEVITDHGMDFVVRVAANLERKAEDKRQQIERAQTTGEHVNPFLPPEPELTVGTVSPTHLAVLNKFNVVEHHLLIVTRRFEDQERLLEAADFAALWRCLAEYPALGFYNGGSVAGASQDHKHLQLVPIPFLPGLSGLPVDALIAAVPADVGSGSVPGLGFRHAWMRLDAAAIETAPAMGLRSRYLELLARVGITPTAAPDGPRQSAPYNLLLTRRWMLVVPRSREYVEGISVNALGFVGSLFVKDDRRLERIRALGPMALLQAVTEG
jgi:ATP adenylyltransferase